MLVHWDAMGLLLVLGVGAESPPHITGSPVASLAGYASDGCSDRGSLSTRKKKMNPHAVAAVENFFGMRKTPTRPPRALSRPSTKVPALLPSNVSPAPAPAPANISYHDQQQHWTAGGGLPAHLLMGGGRPVTVGEVAIG